MTNQKEWEKEVRDVFEKIKIHKKPYSMKINKIEIEIFPNVFSPSYFTDSKWFAETLPKIVGKKSLLEIGTGTGIITLFSALNGAKVTATDINSDAIENAKCNFKKHNVNVRTYLGDMYKPLPQDKKFDFIFWNHPFNKGDNPHEEILLKAGFDFQYKSLKRYISEAHNYLNLNGRLLLGTGNFAILSEIKEIASANNYKMKLLRKIKIPLAADSSINNDYRIYEFIK
jgi:methylase of polypeptide subunit release factors